MGLLQDLMVSMIFAQLVGNTGAPDHKEYVQEMLLKTTCCSKNNIST